MSPLGQARYEREKKNFQLSHPGEINMLSNNPETILKPAMK